MKEKYYLLFSLVAIFSVQQYQSQELHIHTNGSMYVSPMSNVSVKSNLDIAENGALIMDSNATDNSSLIVSGTSLGNITYQRYIPTASWHIVAAPVTTQDIKTFATNDENAIMVNDNGNYGISTYNNSNNAGQRWEYYNAASLDNSGNFITGLGYSNLRKEIGMYSFTGNMASNDVPVVLTAPGPHKWAAIGNPYPAFLIGNDSADNANNLLRQNAANLDENFVAFYLWNGIEYLPINHTSDALHIAPGQGFLVNAATGNNTFTFLKSLLTTQPSLPVTLYAAENATPEITVLLTNGSVNKKTRLAYYNNTTTGLDKGYDAGTYQGNSSNFALDTHLVAESKGVNFTLQCLPDSNYEDSVVPLSIKAAAAQILTFSAVAKNLPIGVKVYINDTKTKDYVDITTDTYAVKIDNSLDGIGRFYLHTSKNSVLNVEDTGALNTASIYKTSNTNLRITGLQQQGTAALKMYNVLGKEIFTTAFKMKTVADVALPKNLTTGIYILQLNANGAQQIQKIFIK